MFPGPIAPDTWGGVGGEASRAGWVWAPPVEMGRRLWTATTDDLGSPITFVSQAGLAVSAADHGNLVFAVGRVSRPEGPVNEPRLFAFLRETGGAVWSRPVGMISLDSFASPALDRARGTVVYASGRWVRAFDLWDGEEAWTCELARNVVNASPAITSDLDGANRLFITDFDGFGGEASLYCINVDPFDPARNPFQPGEIVWSVPIGGSSGNSPAYLERSRGGLGLVYVASVGEFGWEPGRIRAFPAAAPAAPPPAWEFTNTIPEGFFGGVSAAPPEILGGAPRVYAASYAFSGGLSSANLVRIDGATGELAWSVPCGRTQSTPLVLPGGRLVVSTGIQGFGSVPSIRVYLDQGTSATTLWDTALDSWNDLDFDGLIDPGEYLRVGGWTQQPAALMFGGRVAILCGAIPEGTFSQPSNEMFLMDLEAYPASPSFIIGQHPGAGGSAAATGSDAYSVGVDGLVAFGTARDKFDIDLSGAVTIDDLYAWEVGLGMRDVNDDGIADEQDRAALMVSLRLGLLQSSGVGGR
ncbi:hypothetical protein PHYC_01520 [Phycisphaerales bacterium]|nr:hypothetical protein PHYC_01520 [Phycisphaerales bacterium]